MSMNQEPQYHNMEWRIVVGADALRRGEVLTPDQIAELNLEDADTAGAFLANYSGTRKPDGSFEPAPGHIANWTDTEHDSSLS